MGATVGTYIDRKVALKAHLFAVKVIMWGIYRTAKIITHGEVGILHLCLIFGRKSVAHAEDG